MNTAATRGRAETPLSLDDKERELFGDSELRPAGVVDTFGVSGGGFSGGPFVAKNGRSTELENRLRLAGRSSHCRALTNYSLGLIFLNSEARIMASAISFIGLRILRLCC